MQDLRLADHPMVGKLERGKRVTVEVDGQKVQVFEGETIAAVLLAEGVHAFRRTSKSGEPRSLFCGIGICYDCLVSVNGLFPVRACMTPVVEGMVIETHVKAGNGREW